jgi:hypothetical protein
MMLLSSVIQKTRTARNNRKKIRRWQVKAYLSRFSGCC